MSNEMFFMARTNVYKRPNPEPNRIRGRRINSISDLNRLLREKKKNLTNLLNAGTPPTTVQLLPYLALPDRDWAGLVNAGQVSADGYYIWNGFQWNLINQMARELWPPVVEPAEPIDVTIQKLKSFSGRALDSEPGEKPLPRANVPARKLDLDED